MAWRYRAIEKRKGDFKEYGVCEYYERKAGQQMWTDALVPVANSPTELVRILEMMLEDLKRGEKPIIDTRKKWQKAGNKAN